MCCHDCHRQQRHHCSHLHSHQHSNMSHTVRHTSIFRGHICLHPCPPQTQSSSTRGETKGNSVTYPQHLRRLFLCDVCGTCVYGAHMGRRTECYTICQRDSRHKRAEGTDGTDCTDCETTSAGTGGRGRHRRPPRLVTEVERQGKQHLCRCNRPQPPRTGGQEPVKVQEGVVAPHAHRVRTRQL